ncbi:MAG: RelA/SpoT family protein [Muribaculaceae bacterium]|nr:RelA/SpoT family protein [Muribaculaceae bacterium]
MAERFFKDEERQPFLQLYKKLNKLTAQVAEPEDAARLKSLIKSGIEQGFYQRDRFGLNQLLHNMETAGILSERLSPDRNMTIAILLEPLVAKAFVSESEIGEVWGEDVLKLLRGLIKVSTLYSHRAAVESENFRRLLMTFADDIRVIIIMIVDRLALMRRINHHPNESFVQDVAYESNYLYAPLAHRLGLYSIKSELEDMSLKYTNRQVYTDIAHKLNETKVARDAYIAKFIEPLREKLEQSGLNFEIKGRTKSIYSIWNKIQKQKIDVDKIYDLFAIRIIIDTPPEKEKSDCWLAYSIVTDMYVPNTSRLKDWISIPKSNGYESLHITVNGPEQKWVEVQIRTRRMDLVAEKGLAAHWRYKGIKSEGNLDTWMNNVRDILEAAESGPFELIRNFKMDIYSKEVFVFTPKGDLYKLPLGASLLDFAFHIHSKLGCSCTGGLVNGVNKKINYKLQSGDTVEILTSPQQSPKLDWLSFVVTSKARNKIRQTINERNKQSADLAKEMLQRRFKNRKIEIDEPLLMKLIKKLGYKTVTDFYLAISDNQLDVNQVIDSYMEMSQQASAQVQETRSADEYTFHTPADDAEATSDVLIIGNNEVKGLNYKFSRCCNPGYGDKVFGFISADGSINIHRENCPNAQHIKNKYPYRLIPVKWSGKGDHKISMITIVGRDDIGIVTNITSIINKEKSITLRNISVDSCGSLFQGYVVVCSTDDAALKRVIDKLKSINGVSNVQKSS